MNTKTCTKCHNEFPATLEYFRANKKCRLGVSSACKKCLSEQNKKWRLDNIEDVRARDRERDRARNPQRKEENNAYRRDWYIRNKEAVCKSAALYKAMHKERYRENGIKDRLKNKERYKERGKKWKKENREYLKPFNRANSAKRRAIKMAAVGSYTPADIANIYKSQNGKCRYCNIEVGNKYHIDHVVPLSRGGSNYPDNLVIACHSCNESKGAKLLSEWKR